MMGAPALVPLLNAKISLPHSIIEWFVLEGAFKGHLVQPLCNEQGCL